MSSDRFQVIHDRAIAIDRALHRARPGDLVLIAGKGHETYQEIGSVRYAFDDCQVAREILSGMSGQWKSQDHETSLAEPPPARGVKSRWV